VITTQATTNRRRKPADVLQFEQDPLWYKDALVY